jgi:hypothetical protein
LGRGGGYWDIVTYIISQYLIPAILYRDIIYALYCPSGGPRGGDKYGLMGKKYHENNAHADKKG